MRRRYRVSTARLALPREQTSVTSMSFAFSVRVHARISVALEKIPHGGNGKVRNVRF